MRRNTSGGSIKRQLSRFPLGVKVANLHKKVGNAKQQKKLEDFALLNAHHREVEHQRAVSRTFKSFLNGSHGEWTNSDDVKGKGKGQRKQSTGKKVTGVVKQVAKVVAQNFAEAALKGSMMNHGGKLGLALGGAPGGVIGTIAGGALASLMSRIIGSGDYVADPGINTLTNSLIRGPAKVSSTFSRGGSVRIRHREFVKNIVAPGAGVTFAVDRISVQPGLYESFPYLAGIAANYNKYKIHGLVYEFVTTSSSYTSNVAMGAIVMAANYNSTERSYASKSAMENSEGAISGRPCDNIIFGLECADMHRPYNEYWIRTGDTPSISTNLEDYASFQIAMCNLADDYTAGSVVGELWVSYDIEFSVMDLPNLLPGVYSAQRTTCTSGDLLGTSFIAANYQGLCYNVSTDADYIRLSDVPIGTVLQGLIMWNGTSTAGVIAPGTANLSGCTGVQLYNYSPYGLAFWTGLPLAATTTTFCMATFCVAITADNAYIQPTGGTLPGSCVCYIFLTSLGQGISFSATGP